MSWFSGSTKIYVSSVVYNLAGDIARRSNFLKTTVVGAVLGDMPSIPDSISSAYLHGPGLRLKSFARWARTGTYNSDIGLTAGRITSGHSVDYDVLATQIPPGTGTGVMVQAVVLSNADYTYWADQYVAINRPDQIGTAYIASIDNSTHAITITYLDLTTVTFAPVDFDPYGLYLYATYVITFGSTAGSIVTGSTTTGAFPSTAGWTNDITNHTAQTATLNRVVTTHTTYSDSTPPTTTTSTTSSTSGYTEIHDKYEKTVNHPATGNSIIRTTSFLYLDQVGTITQDTTTSTSSSTSGGVTTTVTTTTVQDVLNIVDTYRTDTQDNVIKSWSLPYIFIYKKGSGNATIDAMWNAPSTLGSFFPFIPFRIDNAMVDVLYPSTIYPEAKTAMHRAINAKYDDIMARIKSNTSLGDIDYAYAAFGCCLNTKEDASKKYIYKFFQTILSDPGQVIQSDYVSWQGLWTAAKDSRDAWLTWWNDFQAGTATAADEPVRLPFPAMPINSISVTSAANSVMDYNMTVSWNYMFEETGSGFYGVSAKVGSLEIVSTLTPSYDDPNYTLDPDSGTYVLTNTGSAYTDAVTISWQESATSWRRLTIVGLKHRNLIYKGNAVEILAKDALADVHESGFIIPLHEDIYKSLSIKDYTQMSTACCYLVFNCYQVVKTHWYQTGWFQILLIVVIVVVSVLTFGAGAIGAQAGLLGTNAGIGAAVTGLATTATLAVIVGAVLNALAAMILVMVVLKGATAALGSKLGALIAGIVSMVMLQVGEGLSSGKNFTEIFHDLMSATKLIDLTNSVGNGIADIIKGHADDTLKELQKYQEQNTAQIKSIEEQYASKFGYDQGIIDPTMFTDSGTTKSDFITEPLEVFLSRTLMTGSDIAELSMSMISDFAKLTLTTELV